MTFYLLLSFITSLSMGFLIISLLWPDNFSFKSAFLFKISLSVGLGFGIASCLFFIWLVIFDSFNKGFFMAEGAILASLAAALLYLTKPKKYSFPELDSEQFSNLKIVRVLTVIFFIAAISSIVIFILLSLKNPHGGWDAWAVYNRRARLLFGSNEYWRETFYYHKWGAPHYPLFIPAFIARCWKYINADTVLVPVLASMSFIFATLGLLYSSLSILRSKSAGFLAGLTLLGTTFFVSHGANQYGDVPLAFFYLASIALFSFYDRLSEKNYNFLFLIGMIAAFSGWIKHEGILFPAFIAIARFSVIGIRKGWKVSARQIFFYSIGLLPILIIVFYFKTQIAPPTFLEDIQIAAAKLMDFSRFSQIIKSCGPKFINFGGGIIGAMPLLIFYGFLMGIRPEKNDNSNIIASLITIFLMLTAFFLAYLLIGDYDVRYYILNSFDRWFSQLWPSIIFVFFMAVKTPEEFIKAKERLPDNER